LVGAAVVDDEHVALPGRQGAPHDVGDGRRLVSCRNDGQDRLFRFGGWHAYPHVQSRYSPGPVKLLSMIGGTMGAGRSTRADLHAARGRRTLGRPWMPPIPPGSGSASVQRPLSVRFFMAGTFLATESPHSGGWYAVRSVDQSG